jgi:hypothetical protein
VRCQASLKVEEVAKKAAAAVAAAPVLLASSPAFALVSDVVYAGDRVCNSLNRQHRVVGQLPTESVADTSGCCETASPICISRGAGNYVSRLALPRAAFVICMVRLSAYGAWTLGILGL